MIRYTNKHGLPAAIARAVENDHKEKLGEFSVTELLAPPRMRRLLDTHEVELDVSERIWALLGKGIHAVLDQSSEDRTEIELVATLDGTRISGTIDEDAEGVIRDWKVTSVWTWVHGGRQEWEQQLNGYAWLYRQSRTDGRAPTEPTGLAVTMIFRDWMKTKAGDGSYPDHFVKTIEIPKWEPEHTAAFLRDRLQLHQEAKRQDLPPLCTAEERWHRPDAWAVMRRGRKTALRVLATRDEALAWAEQAGEGGLTLDHRPGKDVRCLDYCEARFVCPHALELQR